MDWQKILGPELAAQVRPESRSKYLKNNPLRQYLLDRFLGEVRALVETTGAKTVLDLGCGEGLVDYFLLAAVPGLQLTGVDADPQALAVARALNPAATFASADVRRVNHPNAAFDLVMANEVLEHLDDYPQALAEAARLSAKFVLLSVPLWPYYQAMNFAIGANWKTWGEHPDHRVSFTQPKLAAALAAAGLRPRAFRRAIPWILVLAEK